MVIELIPTPLVLLIGYIAGSTLYIPKVFFLISTSVLPSSYLRSRSVITFPVNPSMTTRSGATK